MHPVCLVDDMPVGRIFTLLMHSWNQTAPFLAVQNALGDSQACQNLERSCCYAVVLSKREVHAYYINSLLLIYHTTATGLLYYCIISIHNNATCAVDVTSSQNLVKMGGQVEYTVLFTLGTSAVPNYSQLTLTTSGITAIQPTCTAPTGSQTQVIPNSPITDAVLAQNSVAGSTVTWACKFRVNVGENQRAAGEIAPFDVQISFNTSTPAWFIPATRTVSVPVWSGAKISGVTTAVVQTADKFYQGMPSIHASPSRACQVCNCVGPCLVILDV